MKGRQLVIAAAAILAIPATAATGMETAEVGHAFVVVGHQDGSLAVNLDSLVSVFHLAASEGKPARLRLNLEDGSDSAIEGEAAEAPWAALREGAHSGDFLWVSHMGGTLGIPVRSVRSVYRSASGAVRINYPGDPQGKTLQGEEAESVWKQLSHAR